MVRRETYWSTITDSEGVVEQELSYDAWGNRRDPNAWRRNWYAPALEEPMFDRGFTGHEHLYAFGLINMNGRCYDPVMSSFLSVDAYVQSPDNSQSFNRYAYCMNNPLKYTDPSGWRMQGDMNHGNSFNENWGQNYGEKIYTATEVRQMLWAMGIPIGTWMAGNEMQESCSNSGDGGVRNEYSAPDDPPGSQKNNTSEKIQNETNKGAEVFTFFGGALKITSETAGELTGVLKLASRICNTYTGIAIGVNAVENYVRYDSGEISFYSMIARDGMTLIEFGISKVPWGIGIIPSIALTSYDIVGGFEQTLYNDAWAKTQVHNWDQQLYQYRPDPRYQPIYYHHGK